MPSFILEDSGTQSRTEEPCFSCPQCTEGHWYKATCTKISFEGCAEGTECTMQEKKVQSVFRIHSPGNTLLQCTYHYHGLLLPELPFFMLLEMLERFKWEDVATELTARAPTGTVMYQ